MTQCVNCKHREAMDGKKHCPLCFEAKKRSLIEKIDRELQ